MPSDATAALSANTPTEKTIPKMPPVPSRQASRPAQARMMTARAKMAADQAPARLAWEPAPCHCSSVPGSGDHTSAGAAFPEGAPRPGSGRSHGDHSVPPQPRLAARVGVEPHGPLLGHGLPGQLGRDPVTRGGLPDRRQLPGAGRLPAARRARGHRPPVAQHDIEDPALIVPVVDPAAVGEVTDLGPAEPARREVLADPDPMIIEARPHEPGPGQQPDRCRAEDGQVDEGGGAMDLPPAGALGIGDQDDDEQVDGRADPAAPIGDADGGWPDLRGHGSIIEGAAVWGQRRRHARRGSQLKKRMARASPASPQAATTSTSVQWKGVPRNPACIPSAKCLTGKIRAIQRIQSGVLFPNGMKIPDKKSKGRIVALTMAAEASALGITAVIASPSAQNAAAPITSITRNRSRVIPVGMSAL